MQSASHYVRAMSKVKGKDIIAFLTDNRGELKESFPGIACVFAELDWGKINHLQAFGQVQAFILPIAIKEAEKKEKNWIAKIYSDGECIREESFNRSFEAEHWADLRLLECASNGYAEVSASDYRGMIRLERLDAIARIMKPKAGPAMKAQKKTTNCLGFGHKAHEHRYHFSKG